jgi:hypothetical protein
MNIPDAVRRLDQDLREVFGERVKSVVAYESPAGGHAALAIIARLGADDLRSCAGRVAAWHELGLATPLLVAEEEFDRSLDAFPFEFGAILAAHVVVSGTDPFAGLRVDAADLRRASEIQARSHLLHLREGYLETHGRSDAVADLIVRSAPSLAALVMSVARLHGIAADGAEAAARAIEHAAALPRNSLTEVTTLSGRGPLTSERARELFPNYLHGIELLTRYIDRWSPA